MTCVSMCKACVKSLVFLNGLCLEECPVGFQQTSQKKCVATSSQTVKILNKFDQFVRINKDIVLEASVFA